MWVIASTSGSPQLPITSVPRDLTPSVGTCMNMQIFSHRNTFIDRSGIFVAAVMAQVLRALAAFMRVPG